MPFNRHLRRISLFFIQAGPERRPAGRTEERGAVVTDRIRLGKRANDGAMKGGRQATDSKSRCDVQADWPPCNRSACIKAKP